MSDVIPSPDEFLLALTTWREAMNQGETGMLAVAWIIMNRMKSGKFGGSISEVVTQANQFSSMTIRGDNMTVVWPWRQETINATAWITAQRVCNDLLNGVTTDTTGGALYYANLVNLTSRWFLENIAQNSQHPMTVKIGAHTFYR